MIDVDGDYQIRVHVSLIAVDHEVGMLPEIPGAVAFASGSGGGVRVGRDHGARLETVTVFVLDGVLLVIENRVQAFVEMRDVVATVEVVIDENFPVAIDVVGAAVEVVEFADAQGGHAAYQAAEKFGERGGVVVEVDEDETLPGFDSNGDKAVLRAIEIFHAFEFGHTFQGTIEAVVPAVIGTMQERGLAAGFGYDGGGVVTADIVESAQSAVAAADYDDRLAGDPSAYELACRFHLFGAGD